jgi:hypothetical protein
MTMLGLPVSVRVIRLQPDVVPGVEFPLKVVSFFRHCFLNKRRHHSPARSEGAWASSGAPFVCLT